MLRFGVRDEGLRMALTTPLGLGPGQFEEYFVAFPHNVYVFVAAEQGALGILAFLGLVLGTLGMAARSVRLGRDTYGIGSAALLGSWAGLIASGMFVDTLHWRHMWVVAALVWAAAPVRVASAVRVPIADRWRRLPTVAAAGGVAGRHAARGGRGALGRTVIVARRGDGARRLRPGRRRALHGLSGFVGRPVLHDGPLRRLHE